MENEITAGQLTTEMLNQAYDNLIEGYHDPDIVREINRISMEHINAMENRDIIYNHILGSALSISIPICPFTLADLEECYQQCVFGYNEPRIMVLNNSDRNNWMNLIYLFLERIPVELVRHRALTYNNCNVHFHPYIPPGQVWFIVVDNAGMPETIRQDRITFSYKFNVLTHQSLEPITDNDINIISGDTIKWPVR